MNGRIVGALLVVGVVGLLMLSSSPSSSADEPVRVNGLSGNVKARLVGAKRGQGRAAHLIAKFETIDNERREIEIYFPAHSFTTHEATLKAIVESCSDWGDAPDYSKWSRVRNEVIFSVPEKGAGGVGGGLRMKSLDYCYLVSLQLKASK